MTSTKVRLSTGTWSTSYTNEYTATLRFNGIQSSDSGVYTCAAQSISGTPYDRRTFAINVKGEMNGCSSAAYSLVETLHHATYQLGADPLEVVVAFIVCGCGVYLYTDG